MRREVLSFIMKVGVIGGGGIIGSSCAFNVAQREIVDEIVIVDIAEEMALGHALDIEHAVALENDTKVSVGDYTDLSNSDAVVITASAPTPPDLEDRNQLLDDNVPLLEDIFSNIMDEDIDCPVVISTNPVDVLITIINEEFNLDREKIIGYNLNDTLRLRWALAKHTDESRKSVNAYVLGEHGESQVPIYSKATIAGENRSFSEKEEQEIFETARGSAWDIMKNKEETARWATGYGLSIIVDAICENKQKVIPCSIQASGEYGHQGISFGMPVILGRQGAEKVVELDLEDDEAESLGSSVEAIRQAYNNWKSRK